MIWLQLLVVLGAIVLGARIGGAGLGTMAALGLAVLVFVFGLPPSSPPGAVLAIVVAVVTAAATMQAAGGMDLLVAWAERALRANPKWITFVGPAVAYVFTFFAGTGHVAYAILPVIAEVARKAGIRSARPMAVTVIASQQAITASPLSAATAGLIAILTTGGLQIAGQNVQLWHVLVICVPSTFIGCMIAAFVMCFVGKDLADDPEYQKRLADGLVKAPEATPKLAPEARRRALGSIVIFVVSALLIVGFGVVESMRPTYQEVAKPPATVTVKELEKAVENLLDAERREESIERPALAEKLQEIAGRPAEMRTVIVPVATLIQIVMYCAAGLMMLFCGASPAKAVVTPVATAGAVAVVSIVGLGWLGNCFFDGNKQQIVGALSEIIRAHPWVFAVGLFALSVLLFSQASTVAALMPVGIALSLPATSLIAMFPAVNGYFFLPTYGTIVAAIAFDQTGTTRIGRFVLFHSFMLPGLIATISAVAIGSAIAAVIF
ncbi:MAG: anaerobic C4-dicarboxylate transporter family protein [Phycisphaerales bacterium]